MNDAVLPCRICSMANRADRRFCAQCGAPLSAACAHCGFRNELGEMFCGGCGRPAGSWGPAAGTSPAAAPPVKNIVTASMTGIDDTGSAPAAPARRHLTVLFCDLVGSTALSEQLDPEQLADILVAFRDACVDAVRRFEGYPSRYIGDALLVYFGYPVAHEDGPQRAVRAGLEILRRLEELNRRMAGGGMTLAVRVGIHTGMVVVGDIGHGDRQEKMGVVGETPNIAARLQALAQPDAIVVGDSTYRLIEGLYVCEDLGPQQLKGISHPVRAYRVLQESGLTSRFEAKAAQGLLPLVGREEELGILLKRWRQAAQGEGQALLVSGEAGIGKSRILRRFQDEVRKELRNRVVYFCSSYHRDTPYYAVIDQLERALRIDRGDSSVQRLNKLERVMQYLGLKPETFVPPLAALLGLHSGERYAWICATPEDRKQRTFEAITGVLEAMTRRSPVLMIVEDLHWVDPSTMDLLKVIADWVANRKVLLICTHRSEFEPRWDGLRHVIRVRLNHLGRGESAELIARVAGGRGLPGEVTEHIIERTDGVPLFVEELTKTVLESGLLKDVGDRYVLSGPIPPGAIPASLEGSLMARLDRLAPLKEVAQLAAALGRRFRQDLLAKVSKLAEATLNDALCRLMEAELVYRRGLPTEPVYEFKHALVRDAAYNSLLRSRRRELHLEIARILEEQFPGVVEANPELLSHHYAAAGQPERAMPYCILAGDAAVRRYASTEARAHYQAALDMADTLPKSDAAARARTEAILKLASVSTTSDQCERGLAQLEQARRLADERNDGEQLSRVLYWIARMNYVLGQFGRSMVAAEQSLRTAEVLGNNDALAAEPVNLLARLHWLCGDPGQAGEYCARNLGQMHRLGNRIEEAGVSGMLGLVYGARGRYREAIKAAEYGVRAAGSLEHLPTLAACSMYRAVVEGWYGRLQPALRDFERSLAIAERIGDLFRRYLIHGWRGEAYLLCGDDAAAERDLRQAIALADQIGTSFHRGAFQAFLAAAQLRGGAVDQARLASEDAMRLAVQSGQPWSRSIALRVHAEVMLSASPGNAAAAAEAVRTAIGILQEIECRCDLAWSRLVLGRVLHANGDLEGAAAAYGEASRAFENLGIARGIETTSAALETLQARPRQAAPRTLKRPTSRPVSSGGQTR